MASHCPACRAPLAPEDTICVTCGALRLDQHWQLGARGWSVLLGRRALLYGWIWLGACVLLALIPSQAGGVLAILGAGALALVTLAATVWAMKPSFVLVGWLEASTALISGAIVLANPLLTQGAVFPAVITCLVGMLLTIAPVAAIYRRPLVHADPRRCRRCGYLLVDLPTPRCPECGHPFKAVQSRMGRKIRIH